MKNALNFSTFSMNRMKPSFPCYQLLCWILLAPALISAKTKMPVVVAEPANWWTGMQNREVEVLLSSPGIQDYQLAIKSQEVKMIRVETAPNRDFVYAILEIPQNMKAGEVTFMFSQKGKLKFTHSWPVFQREKSSGHQGINSGDLIYLLFPDRFANGDASNDVVSGMHESICDRTAPKGRHGGDLAGISQHLDYISELGITALWLNPVLENNQDYESYHGYAATNSYKIDPRFGTNEQFKTLVNDCHTRGIKVIWDVVYNHWGSRHRLFENLPDSNWVHWFDAFTRTSYRAEVLMDPYASNSDKKQMTDAWFDKHMPDLNQQDPHLARYLIQNSIWWIEYAGLDAFRIDTYAYPDQQFMKNLNEAIRKEYPQFVLFGETWVQGTPVQSWFTEKTYVKKDYSSSLNSVTDFQLFYAIQKGLNENFGWEEGFRRIELTLSQDILYDKPEMLVTFLDNHDLSRFYSMVNEDDAKFKMGLCLLYTLRGIPSIYYGTEIQMKNYADPDAKVREDFPGGWPADGINKFSSTGRNEKENATFELCKTLGNWRKENPWIASAQLMQFVPDDNTYVYFRYDKDHTLMCIYNGNDQNKDLYLARFEERIQGREMTKDILSGSPIKLGEKITMLPKSVLLLEF